MTQAQYWPCRTRRFDLSKPLIMGILNVTPDSFSDGGQHNEPKQAIAWAMRMAQDGADIIDVGGESTRPGAAAVSEEEELRRVIPVVQALASQGLAVSVDTSRARVMREAVAAGAEILNDVRAFTLPGAVEAAVETGAGLIVMHGWDAAKEDADRGEADEVSAVIRYLRERQNVLVAAGAQSDKICWDPGFGFGKTVEQNFELVAETRRFVEAGQPFLMALSRKRAIGAASGEADAARRVSGSVAGALLAVERGAQLVRVHDVPETFQALSVLKAVLAQTH